MLSDHLLTFLPYFGSDIVQLICDYSSVETLQEKILRNLAQKQYCLVPCTPSNQRKVLHQWAQQLGLVHLGILDPTLDSETGTMVKCYECDKWRHLHSSSHVFENFCCTDADGNQACGDVTTECRSCCGIMVYSTGYVAKPNRSYSRKNKMLFLEKNNSLETNRDIVKRCGIKWRTFKKLLRKQIRKHAD